MTLPTIPVVDVRRGGPVEHARLGHETMLALREECLSVVPRALRGLSRPLDRISAAWLSRCPSPYVAEVETISRGVKDPGVWFVNASYEWGCTTRVDADEDPLFRRTLDWPFPGLGRHVQVAIQEGPAGTYANVTWPGAVGVLTAVAPGRFAAAINQAPLFRRTTTLALKHVDIAINAIGTWREDKAWPASHLLRHAFETCATFDEAVELLSSARVARPTLFSVVGVGHGQACLVERMPGDFRIHRGDFTVANDWRPEGDPRPGRWMARGRMVAGVPDSGERQASLAGHVGRDGLAWVTAPVLSPLTRLAVETSPATGSLRVLGYESPGRDDLAIPVTAPLEGRLADGAFHPA